jgi:hypothetical protein
VVDFSSLFICHLFLIAAISIRLSGPRTIQPFLIERSKMNFKICVSSVWTPLRFALSSLDHNGLRGIDFLVTPLLPSSGNFDIERSAGDLAKKYGCNVIYASEEGMYCAGCDKDGKKTFRCQEGSLLAPALEKAEKTQVIVRAGVCM